MIKKTKIQVGPVMAALVLLMSASAAHGSSVLLETGPSTVYTNLCAAEGCLGSTEWTVISSLETSSDWIISGFTFRSADSSGFGTVDYISTTWSIWASDPVTNDPILSGTEVGTITPIGGTFYEFSIDGLATELAAGNYWLGYHHDFSVEAEFTALVTNGVGNFLQTDGVDIFFTHTGELSFQVRGTAVPVPAAIWLFVSSLGLLGYLKRH